MPFQDSPGRRVLLNNLESSKPPQRSPCGSKATRAQIRRLPKTQISTKIGASRGRRAKQKRTQFRTLTTTSINMASEDTFGAEPRNETLAGAGARAFELGTAGGENAALVGRAGADHIAPVSSPTTQLDDAPTTFRANGLAASGADFFAALPHEAIEQIGEFVRFAGGGAKVLDWQQVRNLFSLAHTCRRLYKIFVRSDRVWVRLKQDDVLIKETLLQNKRLDVRPQQAVQASVFLDWCGQFECLSHPEERIVLSGWGGLAPPRDLISPISWCPALIRFATSLASRENHSDARITKATQCEQCQRPMPRTLLVSCRKFCERESESAVASSQSMPAQLTAAQDTDDSGWDSDEWEWKHVMKAYKYETPEGKLVCVVCAFGANQDELNVASLCPQCLCVACKRHSTSCCHFGDTVCAQCDFTNEREAEGFTDSCFECGNESCIACSQIFHCALGCGRAGCDGCFNPLFCDACDEMGCHECWANQAYCDVCKMIVCQSCVDDGETCGCGFIG
jgi:hypothetical protein